jgi:hypothetical protein
MVRLFSALSSASLVLLLASACGSNSSSGAGPCDVIPTPQACQLACSPEPGAPNSCPDGMFCSPDGRCFAQCTAGTGGECGDGYSCTDDGRCQPDSEPPPPIDAMPCPRVNFAAEPVTPSVLLLIDRSDSMLEFFDDARTIRRWGAIRSALIDPINGIVTQLQSKVYFGSMIFSAPTQQNCPALTVRPRALNNVEAIRADLQTDPTFSWTPTTLAVNAAVASFAANPAPEGSPPYIVLATDGFPSLCAAEGPNEKVNTVAATRAAFQAGIRLIPLSVGTVIDNEHLQEVANAGAGVAAGQPNAPLYRGNNPAELKAAFDTIINGVVTCDLTINGQVTQDDAAGAYVLLNGRQIIFGTDWILVGNNVIRLQGAACTELKTSAQAIVNGTFPCGVTIE